MTLGERITALRERRGWSQNQLAERAGVERSHLSKIVRGRYENTGHGTLAKIAAALGVDLSEITGERPLPRRRTEVFEGVAQVPVMRVRVQASGAPTWGDTRETAVVSALLAAGRPNLRAAVVSGACTAHRGRGGHRPLGLIASRSALTAPRCAILRGR